MGWDESGMPTPAQLAAPEIGWAARYLVPERTSALRGPGFSPGTIFKARYKDPMDLTSRESQRVAKELKGVEDPEAGQVADLHPAALAVREDDIGLHPVDRLRQILSDLLGNRELLLLEAVESSQAAAVRLEQAYVQPRDEAQQLQGGETDVEGSEVAGGEIGCLHGERPEGHRRFFLLVQTQEEFTDIEETSRELLCAGEVEDPAVLVAEHQAATGRGEDDVDSLPHRRAEQLDVPEAHLPRPPEIPDAEARDPAAALGRDDHRESVRLQDLHSGLSHVRLVCVREAAIEVDDLPAAAFRRRPGPEPPAEGGVFVAG